MKKISKYLTIILIILAFSLFSCDSNKLPNKKNDLELQNLPGMTFLQHENPQFRKGLQKHRLLNNTGYRLLNTGMHQHQFGDQWEHSEKLSIAQNSGLPYYIDRISGGMPFQSLKGIETVSAKLSDDPNFLGFQVHEWGNSPIHDYHFLKKLESKTGNRLEYQDFAAYEGRTEYPYFSAGDYQTYKDLYRSLSNLSDVEHYIEKYFKQILNRASNQVMSVTGFIQLQHSALRLGAKNIMAEIGNQVPLTALQIAFSRGAGKEFNKPFGVYYESWGGFPFGGLCSTNFTPWYPEAVDILNYNSKRENPIGANYGSSRSLQRRLLYYSWLSGSSYWSEEWGAENYFSNWDNYPLTEYGSINKDFQKINNQYSKPNPIVPIALIMPPNTFGVDIRFIAGNISELYQIAEPNIFHKRLSAFAKDVLDADHPKGLGKESGNLTPSPWISSFDVLSANAPKELLDQYQFFVYFNENQANASPMPQEKVQIYKGKKRDADYFIQIANNLFPYQVEGKVGTAHARSNDKYLLGIFNNLGITKTVDGEVKDFDANQTAIIKGNCRNIKFLIGKEYMVSHSDTEIKLNIPAGMLSVMSFPEDKKNNIVMFDFSSIVTAPYISEGDNLFLNKTPISILCDTDNASIYYTLNGDKPDRTSHLYTGSFNISKSAHIKLRAYLDDRFSPITNYLFEKTEFDNSIELSHYEPGLIFNYFKGEFNTIDKFSLTTPQNVGTCTNFTIIDRDREKYFSFDFKGYIKIPSDDLYTFYLSSNDGSALYINNNILIDNDGLHAIKEKNNTIALREGMHKIGVKYFQNGGSHNIKVSWQSNNINKSEIPPAVLFHSTQ